MESILLWLILAILGVIVSILGYILGKIEKIESND